MRNDVPDKLREYLKTENTDLGDRADNFWKVAKPILDRQSSVNMRVITINDGIKS